MSVTSNVRIKLSVLNSKQVGTDCMVVYFVRPIGFNYEAGDWVDLVKDGVELKGGNTYSLSSSPTEDNLAVMFRKGMSSFKQTLQALEPDDEMTITQYGNDYGFHLRENRTSVLIAGGIGIAPFRSMLKEMFDAKDKSRVQLLYFNKGSAFLLTDELKEWAKSLSLDIHYLNTEQLQRKDRLRIFQEAMNRDAHHYFIAGPTTMVESTEHMLIDLGISKKDIRIDSFGGY